MDILGTGFDLIHRYQYLAIVVLLMLGIVGLPIPDETLLVFVGYLNYKGDLWGPWSLVSAVLGSASGITISYGLGRLLGARVTTAVGKWLHLSDRHAAAARRWMNRWGPYTLLVAYFVPGMRHVGALAAGAAGLRFSAFAICAYTGALLWSATFIGVGYALGEAWVASSMQVHQTVRWMGIGVGVTLTVAMVLVKIRRRGLETRT